MKRMCQKDPLVLVLLMLIFFFVSAEKKVHWNVQMSTMSVMKEGKIQTFEVKIVSQENSLQHSQLLSHHHTTVLSLFKNDILPQKDCFTFYDDRLNKKAFIVRPSDWEKIKSGQPLEAEKFRTEFEIITFQNELDFEKFYISAFQCTTIEVIDSSEFISDEENLYESSCVTWGPIKPTKKEAWIHGCCNGDEEKCPTFLKTHAVCRGRPGCSTSINRCVCRGNPIYTSTENPSCRCYYTNSCDKKGMWFPTQTKAKIDGCCSGISTKCGSDDDGRLANLQCDKKCGRDDNDYKCKCDSLTALVDGKATSGYRCFCKEKTCFSADGEVVMSDSRKKKIKDVRAGEKIMSLNEKYEMVETEVALIVYKEVAEISVVHYVVEESKFKGEISVSSNHFVYFSKEKSEIEGVYDEGKKLVRDIAMGDSLIVVLEGKLTIGKVSGFSSKKTMTVVVMTENENLFVDGVFASMHSVKHVDNIKFEEGMTYGASRFGLLINKVFGVDSIVSKIAAKLLMRSVDFFYYTFGRWF